MDDLVRRLRGKYPVGPIQANGEPEFGGRTFPEDPPNAIQLEAADRIEHLLSEGSALKCTNKG